MFRGTELTAKEILPHKKGRGLLWSWNNCLFLAESYKVKISKE